MTANIIGIRKTAKGTIVYLAQKMTEIDGVSTGCCTYVSWFGEKPCDFVVNEDVYISKPYKGFVEISKLKKG